MIHNKVTCALVRNGRELLDAVVASLARLQEELQGELPSVTDLWNHKPCTPKDEESLSDYIVRHLREDLKQRGIVINREVQIRRGSKTDIHVSAPSPPKGDGFGTVTAIIEVKGGWHQRLYHDMETQLVNRYMGQNACDYGLYMVGDFNCGRWDPSDPRYLKSRPRTAEGMRQRLEKTAAGLSADGRDVRSVVLDLGWHA